MSTLSFVEKRCYICGSVNRYGESSVLSFSAPSGLDGNPGNLTPLFTAIHICPNCFYASTDVSRGDEATSIIVRDRSYQTVAGNQDIHELVRKYIAWALIQHRKDNDCEAARTMLYATWLSEQYENEALTSQCRRKAIEMMSRCRANGGNFEMTRGKEILTIVDLYRRESEFTDALEICTAAISSGQLTEDEEFLLRYEEKLCKEQNSNAATIHDAEKNL